MATGPAKTAVEPMSIVAMDQYEQHPLVQDELAHHFLPPTARAMAAVARWPKLREVIRSATEHKFPGLWASMLCRKRYFDDAVTEAVSSGCETVIILGAGLDDRAYRLPALADIPVFEVDLPRNITEKYQRLHALFCSVPKTTTLVPVDFERQNLAEVLGDYGYRADRPTYFLWEAVTQYLTERDVRRTFDFLGTAPVGSRLGFTYVRSDFLSGQNLYDAREAHRQFVTKSHLWRFGMSPDTVTDFLTEYGWHKTEDLGATEFNDRYLEPAHRRLPLTQIERAVSAEKR
ncbi:methyltransferase [Prauserella marina]|nr:SAM-dependent methyltransferase [Prauserella marina]ASR34553.1 methyltransferase [Prauserella marina]